MHRSRKALDKNCQHGLVSSKDVLSFDVFDTLHKLLKPPDTLVQSSNDLVAVTARNCANDRVTDDDDVGIAWSALRGGHGEHTVAFGESVASHAVIDSTQAKFCSVEMGAGDFRADPPPLISAGCRT